MPILDWMRTDPFFTLDDGSKALRFEKGGIRASTCSAENAPVRQRITRGMRSQRRKARLQTMTQLEKDTLYKNAFARSSRQRRIITEGADIAAAQDLREHRCEETERKSILFLTTSCACRGGTRLKSGYPS